MIVPQQLASMELLVSIALEVSIADVHLERLDYSAI